MMEVGQMPNPINTYVIGSAVKITTVLNIETAVVAIVTIYDPNGSVKIDSADMTKDANNVYSYVYQSDEDDTAGEYVAKIEVTSSGYVSVVEEKFTLLEQSN